MPCNDCHLIGNSVKQDLANFHAQEQRLYKVGNGTIHQPLFGTEKLSWDCLLL